jgi:hypothetical protein
VGGLLTIDHFQPRSKGGTDALENLIYACINCNQHKQDYWPHDEVMPGVGTNSGVNGGAGRTQSPTREFECGAASVASSSTECHQDSVEVLE